MNSSGGCTPQIQYLRPTLSDARCAFTRQHHLVKPRRFSTICPSPDLWGPAVMLDPPPSATCGLTLRNAYTVGSVIFQSLGIATRLDLDTFEDLDRASYSRSGSLFLGWWGRADRVKVRVEGDGVSVQ